MRGNSGLLRWLASYCSATNRTLLIFLLVAMAFTHAGPLNTRHRRMIREVYSEFDQAQNITAEGTCLHHGTSVPETSLQCEKKAGCRAIQKTGYCCPDYQCHCERDGKIYANGEKLVDPETPCKGCYCQGGEILCNSVNCYIRNDCEPKYIAGRCCPEYDNCPPIVNKLKNTASPQFKIKEITKPEEIRIIDEKPKTSYQIIKPFESTSTNQQPKNFSADESTSILQPNLIEENTSSIAMLQTTTEKSRFASNEDAENITILTSTETTLPEVSEEMGKEVVIVDSNGQTKPITVFGVFGLQRGDVLDEVSEYEEKKSSAKRSESNGHAITEQPYDTSTGPEIIYENTSAGLHTGTDVKTVSEIEPVASSSDNFIQILETTKLSESIAIDSTTESVTGSNNAYDMVYYTVGPDRLVLEDNISNNSSFENTSFAFESNDSLTISTAGPSLTAESMLHRHHSLMDDDENTSNEPNPAYPSINDDLSIYGTKVLNSEEDTLLKEEKLLHNTLMLKSNNTRNLTTESVLINYTESVPVLNDTAQEEDTAIVPNYLIVDSSVESGDGPILTKEREHTTPNTSKVILDIDEDGSGRVEHDPKEDSESLKFHEDRETGFPKPALDSGIQTISSAVHGFYKSHLIDILNFT